MKLRDAAALEETPEFSRKIRVVVDRADPSDRTTFFRDEEVAQRENLHIVREYWDMGGSGSHDVTKGDIDDVVSKWTGIPIAAVKEEESAKLLRMEEELHKRIVSQENAISAVARAIRRTRAGLKNPHRPVGSFLFLGPTGVSKTEVARSWPRSSSAPSAPHPLRHVRIHGEASVSSSSARPPATSARGGGQLPSA